MASCSTTPRPMTRDGRRRRSAELYRKGKSRGPYALSKTLNSAVNSSQSEGDEPEQIQVGTNRDIAVCSKCKPALLRHEDMFKSLKKQGSSLKKVKKVNPRPKRANFQHYRDLKSQNDWLRSNVLDAVGNYLYCSSCIRAVFGVSKQRLARQQSVKQSASKKPIQQLTKSAVEEQKLNEFTVMPSECDDAFSNWWKGLQADAIVNVRYPHEQHGLARRISNSAKKDEKTRFLEFVDNNSQPNGRDLNSYGPTHYFLPKFTTIQALKAGVRNYEHRLLTSLTGEFNRAQEEEGKPTVSSFSVSKWLKQHRPKHAIYPHKLDYCDTCAGLNNELQGAEMRLKRLLQSGSCTEAECADIEKAKKEFTATLDSHKAKAHESHEAYNEAIRRCKQTWAEISEVEQNPNFENGDRLAQLKE